MQVFPANNIEIIGRDMQLTGIKRDTRSDVIPLLILFFTLIGISLLIVSLYRILYNGYDREHADRFYRRTLNYFMAGVIFSFLGGLLKMVHTLFLS